MREQLDAVLREIALSGERFEEAIRQLKRDQRRHSRLWAYYANPMRETGSMTDPSERPYRHAQEWGMPVRITGYWPGSDPTIDGAIGEQLRKEVVVENDIAWRIDTMVDYLFGEMPHIQCGGGAQVQRLIDAIIARNGGVGLFQQIALLGAVHGFVDVAVTLDVAALEEHQLKRASGSAAAADTGANNPESGVSDADIQEVARLVSLQIVEPARALLLTDANDTQRVAGYAQVYQVQAEAPTSAVRRIIGSLKGNKPAQVVELWTNQKWWRWRDEELEAAGGNSLGRIPVVHIQNAALPFSYSGASDVEPLIPLQDELNVRLSDRAYRIARESFRMYLSKGVDTDSQPPGPGRVWKADPATPDAEIVELGGASNCPAEDSHIADVRESLDKASGVPPVAAGAIRNRIGNLTSAAALRITLMSLLARTRRKQALYGEAIRRLCEMSLAWLDCAGIFRTTPDQREVEVNWPSPLPENNAERLAEAKLKLDMGLGKEVVLKELGY